MKDIDREAFEPVLFPEVRPGFVFNANFCRNPTCPNSRPVPDPDVYAERYSAFRDADVRTRHGRSGSIVTAHAPPTGRLGGEAVDALTFEPDCSTGRRRL